MFSFKSHSLISWLSALILATVLLFSCNMFNSDDDDDTSSQVTTYTVTFYADTTSTTPRTASIESGNVFSYPNTTAPEDYTFKSWISADGTDYTSKGITSDITLFAYFEKSSTTTSGDTVTTNGEALIKESEKVETTVNGATTTVINITITTVSGEIVSKEETTIDASGTTTTTITDANGNATTTVTDATGSTVEAININEILLKKLSANSTAQYFKPSATAPASTVTSYVINASVNAVAWLDGKTIYYYAKGYTDSGKKIPLGASAQGMFSDCSSLTTIDMTGFDTSSATNMSCMFDKCTSLVSVDVSKLNTSNVTNMAAMFGGCKKLAILDVSNFNTKKVTSFA